MSAFDIILVIYGVVLALTALTVVYRMVVGPTILDRAVSTDSLVVLVVIAMALYTASAKASWAGPAMLALTGLAFIGTVTFARFVGREEPRTPQLRRHRQESSTSTGPLDAIHVDHRGEEHAPAHTEPVAVIGAEQAISEGAGSSEGIVGADEADEADGAGHSDHFERGFGAEAGSRGFEVEAHDDEVTDAPGSSDSTSSTSSSDSTGTTEETR
ncbi:monovalent cation/H+ antiporter complex subunit F [Brachybacterium tyrofermentans]|uniref:monovalent cation/H+ antiporter complex subunit F n=1 Tax=Brachybacterium tyrofermentans TaxID=47848 RepID=UPI003FD25A2A